MIIRKFQQWLSFWAVIVVLVGCESPGPPATFVRKIDWIGKGQWVKADTHIHTKFSDGANTVSEVAFQARQHGCDVIAITDHADSNLQAATPEYADAIRAARREHPNLIILAGLEWNVPPFAGDEHATLLVPRGPREFDTLAEFKQRFDDLDRERHDDQLAIGALNWLAKEKVGKQVPPLIIYNHPNRKTAAASATATQIETWRATNDLVIGFSGAPGHQRGQQLGAYGGAVQLIDRWDPAVAEVGGAWDQLLAKGIDVWAARAPSDFHSARSANVADYWPGEFSETWLYVPEKTGKGVLEAFRAGSFFAAHGHIARNVELTVNANGLDRPAHPGETIEVVADTKVTVSLSANVPQRDWEAAPSQIDVVELIVLDGDDTRVVKLDTNGTARVAVSKSLTVNADGLVVRARGRRKIANGPDLLFYTNPVRIQTPESILDSDSKPNTTSASTGRWQFNLRFASAITILTLLLLSIVVTMAGSRTAIERPVRTDGTLHSNSSRVAPHRIHYFTAALGFTLFAIYGSLVPLSYRPLEFDVAVERFRQIPFLQLNIAHRADWVANILLFIPISYCWLATLLVDTPRRMRNFAWALPVILCCCCLSVAVEFTQLWFPPRTVSQNDIVAESLGGVIGALLWYAIGQHVTNWIRSYTGQVRPNSQFDWLLQAYLAGLVIYSLIPFDLTIHPVEIYRKLREGKIVLVPFWKADFGLNGLWGRFTDMLIFVPVGCLVTRLLVSPPHTSRSLVRAILLGAGIVAAIEVAQIFVYSRYAETTDVITGVLGIAIGAWLTGRWQSADNSSTTSPTSSSGLKRSLAWIMSTVVYAGVVSLVFWWPLQFTSDSALIAKRLDGFMRVPLASLYWGTEFNAATQFLRKTLYFLPLGLLSAQVVYTIAVPIRMRRVLLIAAALFCIAVATTIELVQAMLPTHVCDLTDTILYSLGAIAGIVIRSRVAGAAEAETAASRPDTKWTNGGRNKAPVERQSPFAQSVESISTKSSVTKWALACITLVVVVSVLVFNGRPDHTAQDRRPQSFAELTGSQFAPAPSNLDSAPVISEIEVPGFAGAYAIWGSTGRDLAGHIWFGVSATGIDQPSAHLFELDPELGVVHDRGSVLTELKRAGLYRPGEGQMKIHTKIIQAADGHLYFASMDEQGESEDGSQLPTWGSHLWRLRLPEREWEHVKAVPEGLIALSGVGRYVYALGLFDHILYQYDTQAGDMKSVRVGSVGGHTSRNLISDHRGHVYVPRVRNSVNSSANRSPDKERFPTSLVEFDEQMREVAESPILHYGANKSSSSHGIIGFTYLQDGSIAFTTHRGRLYRIVPPPDHQRAQIESLGWFHPEGTAYTPSLFTYAGKRYLVGVAKHRKRPHEWLEFDLASGKATATPIDLNAVTPPKANNLLLYGSITRDNSGAFYVAGRYIQAGRKQPILLRLEPNN